MVPVNSLNLYYIIWMIHECLTIEVVMARRLRKFNLYVLV